MKQERMPHEDGQSQEQQRTKKPSFFSYFRPSFKTAEQIVQEEGELKQKTEKLKGIDSSSVTSKGFAGVFEDMKKVGEGGITIGSVIYLLLYGGAFVQGKIIKYALKKIDSGFIKDFDANIKMITEFFSRKKEGGRVGGGKEDKKKLTESDVKEVESNIKRAAIENLLQTRQEVKQQNQWTQDDQAMYEKSWKELKRWAENKDIWTRENETLFVREVSFSEEDALTPQEQKRKTQIGQIKKKKEQRVSQIERSQKKSRRKREGFNRRGTWTQEDQKDFEETQREFEQEKEELEKEIKNLEEELQRLEQVVASRKKVYGSQRRGEGGTSSEDEDIESDTEKDTERDVASSTQENEDEETEEEQKTPPTQQQ